MRPQLATPDYMRQVIKVDGINSDIVTTLNNSFNRARQETKDFFVDGSPEEKAQSIWSYIKNNVQYKKDAAGTQIIQFPSRMILGTKAGDCKSMALAAAGMMAANGFNNVRLRYTSYDSKDSTPTHVYTVGNMGGKEFIIDAVFTKFNKELPYKSKKDYPMHISVLSGPPMFKKNVNIVSRSAKQLKNPIIKINSEPNNLKRLLSKVKPGGIFFNVISNKLGRDSGKITFMRYDQDQLNKYKQMLIKIGRVQEPTLNNLVNAEIKLINDRAFTGNIVNRRSGEIAGISEEIGKISFRKIGKGIKKFGSQIKKAAKKINPKTLLKGIKAVGLVVPRKAFLALLALNVRGLATRLSKISQPNLKKMWVDRLGGQMSVLNSAISRGKKKKSIGDNNLKVIGIPGIGYVVDNRSIGVSPPGGADAAGGAGAGAGSGVDIASLIKVAGPIIDLIISFLNKIGSKKESEEGDFEETEGKKDNAYEEYIDKAVDIAEDLGIIPERKLDRTEQAVDAAIPGDDHTDMYSGTSSLKINPLYIGGAVLAAYLLLKKK